MSLVRSALLGAVAGVAGTIAMDAVWRRRYDVGGGTQKLWDWETSAGVDSYDTAGAPAQVGEIAYKAVLRKEPPPQSARAMANLMHWGTGIQWAALYGVAASRTRYPLLTAAAFGPSVWALSYVALPLLKVYKPIWEYDAKTLWQDFSAHLVYGGVTTATFAALNR